MYAPAVRRGAYIAVHVMKTNRLWPLMLLAAAISSLTACSRSDADDARPLVTVSVEPQRYLVEQIAGDRFRVVTLMPNGENPEMYEPPVASRMAVDRSRVFFSTGFFPFESAAALAVSGSTAVVNTSEGIDLIYGTHSHADGHANFLHVDSAHRAPDPHVWTSVRNTRIMASRIAQGLIDADPDNADSYRTALGRIDRSLDSLDRVISEKLDTLPTRTFLVWHPSLTYFARDYDLEQLAVSADSRESSMPQMRRVIDEARADSVRVFFYQKEYDPRQARAINSGVGSHMLPIQPNSYSWLAQLDSIADELARP